MSRWKMFNVSWMATTNKEGANNPPKKVRPAEIVSEKWLKLINACEQLPRWVEHICLPWQWAFSEYIYCTYIYIYSGIEDIGTSGDTGPPDWIWEKIVWRLYEAWQAMPRHHLARMKNIWKMLGTWSWKPAQKTRKKPKRKKLGKRFAGKVTTMANKFAAFPRTCIGCFLLLLHRCFSPHW